MPTLNAKKPRNNDQPTNSNKGKLVVVDRTFFEQFAIKPAEEETKPSSDNVDVTDELMVEMQAEVNSFKPIIFTVSKENIGGKELESKFGNRYIEGHSHPRVFAVKLHLEKCNEEKLCYFPSTNRFRK